MRIVAWPIWRVGLLREALAALQPNPDVLPPPDAEGVGDDLCQHRRALFGIVPLNVEGPP